MIEAGEHRQRGPLEAVVGGIAAQEEPIVGVSVEALHVGGSRPPRCFHRCADERGMLDIAKDDQLLSGLQIGSDTNRKLGKPLEELLLIHGRLLEARYSRTRRTRENTYPGECCGMSPTSLPPQFAPTGLPDPILS